MNLRTRFNARGWLLTLLLAALLGAQAVQAAHVHADHLQSQDCLQCKLDNGQAVLPDPARTPTATAALIRFMPLAPAVIVADFFRLPARGPPTFSD